MTYMLYIGNNDDIYKYKSKVTFIEKRKGVNFKTLNIFMTIILI